MKRHRIFLLLALLMGAVPASRPVEPQGIERKCTTLLAIWKERFDKEGLSHMVVPPFVIAGDGGMNQLKRYRWTIDTASEAMESMYFKAKPSDPLLILLFDSEQPYRRLSKEWFRAKDPPHYGYCCNDGTMVMNIGTGGGTLVHELVHALMKPDFPNPPTWFNEGLASLYEQCQMEGKTLRGLENWRLPALQRAIKAGKLRSIEALVTSDDFYRDDLVGLNYAQARYLMFYLQEKNLLRRYYASLRDGVKDDPDGLITLKSTIGPQLLGDFEKEWHAWVLQLRFP